MKRKLAFLMAFVMFLCLGVTACGDDSVKDKSDNTTKKSTTTTREESQTVEEITVEKFIGMSYIEEIKNNSAYDGVYEFNVIEEDANDPDRDVGEVFKQSPAAGETVKKGAKVTLYVNNGTPDDVTLDIKTQIVGKHRDEIRKLLQDAGLRVQEKLASHDEIEKDYVIEIDIELGKAYPYGKLVTVTVSSGAEE